MSSVVREMTKPFRAIQSGSARRVVDGYTSLLRRVLLGDAERSMRSGRC
jgi:hypothetical protein